MNTNSISLSTTLFILLNILLSIPTQAQIASPVSAPSPNPDASSPATAPQPSPASTGLNCRRCRISPIGLAACGLVISGVMTPITVRTCCRTLRPLKDQGASCLCYAITTNAIKIGSINVMDAVDQVLAACNNM